MRFRSLFIGIDKYLDASISDLCCSARDAQALHALFCDTFGTGQSVLLTDRQATRSAILDGMHELTKSSPEDVVVIGFSGHGSDSHHLITNDSDALNLDATAIHLDELTTLFSVCQKTPLSELSCHDPPHFPRQLQPNFVQEDASDRSGWGDWWWTGPDLRNAAIGRRSRLLGSGFKG